jgi:hypothetical protein
LSGEVRLIHSSTVQNPYSRVKAKCTKSVRSVHAR